MLLFMVMPALFGGFGNSIYRHFNILLNNNLSNSLNNSLNNENSIFNVHNQYTKSKKVTIESKQSHHPQLGPYLVRASAASRGHA